MSQYKLHYSGVVIIQPLANGAQRQIPLDPTNGDYQTYLAWVAAGNTPDPADPAPLPDPQAALDQADLTDFRQTILQGLQALGWTGTLAAGAWGANTGQWDALTPANRTTFMRRLLRVLAVATRGM